MNRFEKLCRSAADDGASSLSGAAWPSGFDDEAVQLLKAWEQERTERIECSLVLDQMCRLLHELMVDEPISPRRRRQAGRLLRAAVRKNRADGDAADP